MYRPLDQAKGGAFFCRANLFALASRESSIRVTEDPPFCPSSLFASSKPFPRPP